MNKKIDNYAVYRAVDKALKELGLKNLGGSDVTVDGQNGIGNDYRKGKYNVKVTISN